MKLIITTISAMALVTASHAQPDVSTAISTSIESSVRDDVTAALNALEADDFDLAAQLLRTAGANANRLSLQSLTQKIAGSAPAFNAEEAKFVAARSSTVALENFFASRDTPEQKFTDAQGRTVTVRILGEQQDLTDFERLSKDTAMLKKAGLEMAEMRGEPAIKRRNDDGELSVLMMSEEDHALIEVEGDNENTVMTFIGALEQNAQE